MRGQQINMKYDKRLLKVETRQEMDGKGFRVKHNLPTKHPKEFFTSLPTELWLLITTFLPAEDIISLKLASKTSFSIIPSYKSRLALLDYPDLVRRFQRDWEKHAAHQTCMLCWQPHQRLHAQQRVGATASSCHASCVGGIRLTADHIICKMCWMRVLLSDEYRKSKTKLPGTFRGRWLRSWQIEHRRGSFLLKVESRFPWRESGSMEDWRVSPTGSILVALMNHCGCPGAEDVVVQSMHSKLACRYPCWLRRLLRTLGTIDYTCASCGALYIMDIRKTVRNKIPDTPSSIELYVTRYQNLSAAITRAACLEPDPISWSYSPGLGAYLKRCIASMG